MGNSDAKEENPFEITSNTLYPSHIRLLQDHFINKLSPTDGLVSQSHFMEFLDLPQALVPFGDRLFHYICSVTSVPPVTPKRKHHTEHHHQSSKLFTFKQLVLAFEPIFRGHSAQQVTFLFDVYKKNDVIDQEEGRTMLRDIALISELNRVYYMEDTINTFNEEIKMYDNRIGAVLDAIALVYPFPLNCSQLVSWCCLNTPSLGKAFEYYIWHKFLRRIKKEEPDPNEECLEFWPPYLISSDISKIPECTSFIWLLACTLELNQSTWKTIYAASTHGRSLNRLCNQIVDYGGPTLLLILDGKGGIFGVYTSEEWRSKADFRADKTSFLFSLSPHFGVYRATGADSNNLYLYNNPNPHAQFPVGVGFGGIIRACRLWISDDLEKGESREICTSYARGKISQSIIFEIHTIEVWGCGGDKAEEIQKQAKVSKDKEIERRRKVKKELITETWDSGPSKFLMDMAGKTGASDEFLDDVRKIRKMREDQKAEREKSLKKEF